jgi:ABC-type iron transport system FetAB ATPase subunit
MHTSICFPYSIIDCIVFGSHCVIALIAALAQGTVRDLLMNKIRAAIQHPQFVTDVMKPMMIEQIYDQEVAHLSGGEMQRVALVLALGKPADIYLIDEPSAYLDSEQRIVAAKVIKRYGDTHFFYFFFLSCFKTEMEVQHDEKYLFTLCRPSRTANHGREQQLLTRIPFLFKYLFIFSILFFF